MKFLRWIRDQVCAIREVRPDYAIWEMVLMRLAFSALVLWSMGKQSPPLQQPIPNGLCLLMDLTWLAQPETWALAKWITAAALVLFTVGISGAVTLAIPTFVFVAMGSLVNSQGAIKHYNQLIAMSLLAFWLAAMLPTLWRIVRKRAFSLIDPATIQRMGVYWVMVTIAASYVTSAFSKLIATEGMWIFETPNLAVQLVKSHLTVFHDTITTTQTVEYPAIAQFLVDHTWIAPIMFGPGLIVELFFFLALAGRAWAAILGISAIAMHMIVAWVMKLVFPEHEALMLIFFVNIPFWLVVAAQWARSKWTR